jgi:hypothetical protein
MPDKTLTIHHPQLGKLRVTMIDGMMCIDESTMRRILDHPEVLKRAKPETIAHLRGLVDMLSKKTPNT